jgi:hypothetical protein
VTDDTLIKVNIKGLILFDNRFSLVGLNHLAERAALRYLQLCRSSGKIERMAEAYDQLATVFKASAEAGKNAFAMGKFYWVQYIGEGVPVHLRKEFIYRNPANLHVSEFHTYVRAIMDSAVQNGVEVRIAGTSAPTSKDAESKDAIIFVTSVKPVFDEPSEESPFTNDMAQQFIHYIPFTQV